MKATLRVMRTRALGDKPPKPNTVKAIGKLASRAKINLLRTLGTMKALFV